MKPNMQAQSRDKPYDQQHRKWRIVIICGGLIIQGLIIVLSIIFLYLKSPGVPDVRLAPVAHNLSLCRVVSVEPFTYPWMQGLHGGTLIRLLNKDSSGCQPADHILQAIIVGQNGPALYLEVQSTTPTPTELFWIGILIIIFNVTGSALFLRARNRSTAPITYLLFYCVALQLSLASLHHLNYLWVNVLSFWLAPITLGLSTTFVCLFPAPFNHSRPPRPFRGAPYLPLWIGLGAIPLSLLAFFFPQMRSQATFVILSYNLVCLLTIIWMLVWGLRHCPRREKQVARMVVIGVIFLLVPLIMNENILPFSFTKQNIVPPIILLPPAILPIISDYALFRQQLIGTASIFSRRVMRMLLWLLLASLFTIPVLVIVNIAVHVMRLPDDMRNGLYVGLLVISLCLFPFLWSKVRDVGDQIIYRDFYEYNRALREVSTSLTQLQGLEQISTFLLPHLTTLLNATDTALLVRKENSERGQRVSKECIVDSSSWQVYRDRLQNEQSNTYLQQIANDIVVNYNSLHPPLSDPLLLGDLLWLALHDGQDVSGFLCLGPKRNEEPYSRQDKSFLATLAAQLSVLLVNSRYLEQARINEQRLIALTHRVMSAQENERRHLALELHDEVLQHAMLVVGQLSDAESMRAVAEVIPLARSVVSSLRRTSLELHPPLLDELGLEEALRWLGQQMEQRGTFKITFYCVGEQTRRLSSWVELALYRVAQEALSNVFKHAAASKVTLRLRHTPQGGHVLLICDNGHGFNRGQRQNEHLGLVSMQERMIAVGGRLQLRTSSGKGTCVRANVPPGNIVPETAG